MYNFICILEISLEIEGWGLEHPNIPESWSPSHLWDQWRMQENFSRVQVYGRPRRGSGGRAPGTPENFRKFAKKFLKKIEKMHYFSLFFKIFQNYALNFCAFELKTQLVGKFLRNFWKFWWKFNRKLDVLSIFGKVVAKNSHRK